MQPAAAQSTGLTITPRFTASVQATDNRLLSATNPRSDIITTLSPGLSITSGIRGLRGSIDYQPSYVHFARGTGASGFRDGLSNALQGSLSTDFLENRITVAVAADVSRQSVSALGLQGDRPNDLNPNSTERRTLSVVTTARETLPGDVLAQARVAGSISRAADSQLGDADTWGVGLSLSRQLGAIGVGLTWDRDTVSFGAGRSTTNDRARGTLSYLVDPSLRLFANAGTERSDVPTVDSRSYTTYGGGLNWTPTPRTSLGLQGEKRYFGNSFALNLSHRFRRSSLSYVDSRNVVESTAGVGSTLTAYQIFFAQFASLEPDPVLRDRLVRDFLRNAGIDPNERVGGGFLNNSVAVQRSRNLSWGWQALRLSTVLTVFSTRSERADRAVGGGAGGDLATVNVLRQHGFSGSASWRLTPESSLVFNTARQVTPGRGAVAGNGLTVYGLSWVDRLSRTASVSVTARRAQATGANPYTENSLQASLNLSF